MYKVRSTDGKYKFMSAEPGIAREVEYDSFSEAKKFLFSTLRASLPDSIEFAIYDTNDEMIFIDKPVEQIWFTSEQHRSNFVTLMQIYSHRGNDVQYKAHNYIAAYPALFDCLDMETVNNSYGVIYSIMEWNEEEGQHVFTSPALTSTTKFLAEIGLSLYNGYKADLDRSCSEEITNVIIQAIKIRNKI